MICPMTADLAVLSRFSTCTVANAIELFEIRPRNEGFLRTPMHCLLPDRAPVAGYAAVCHVSAERPDSFGRKSATEYWEHIERTPGPRIAVVRDLDPRPSAGSFFGEVNASIHTALGCAGAVVDGAVRDLVEMRAIGFQTLYREASVSHAYIHLVDFGQPVVIDGAVIRPGDLLQMDQHGVLIVPPETLGHLAAAIAEIEMRERPVIAYCQSGTATRQGIQDAMNKHIWGAPKWSPTPRGGGQA
jgi:4-hydroxy-4-methyl-2-oxoglutarate aldolase